MPGVAGRMALPAKSSRVYSRGSAPFAFDLLAELSAPRPGFDPSLNPNGNAVESSHTASVKAAEDKLKAAEAKASAKSAKALAQGPEPVAKP